MGILMKLGRKILVSTLSVTFLLSIGLNVLFLMQGGKSAHAGKLGLSLFGELTVVREVLQYIRKQFVDPKKVEKENLIYGAVEGMLSKLGDPYSRFMPPRDYNEMQIETQGSFGGLGIIIGQKGNRIVVISPLINTPAYKAGMAAGDQIVKVDDQSIKGKNVNDVAQVLRGKKGTKVKVTVYREGQKKLLDFVITRDSIHVPSVSSKMLDDGIGYIYLSSFIKTSDQDVDERIRQLRKQGMKGLVLDLRHNPGGLLEAAVKVGRLFLPKGDVIVSVKDNADNEMKYASFGSDHGRFPLVVLVDQGSASASEILAGAVRDHKRGILVGKKTFGKGSVQTVLPLSDNSALALTTAYYYTPSGTLIHNKGLTPDIEVDLPEMTQEQILKLRVERGKFLATAPPSKDEPMDKPDMEFLRKFDTQFQRAVEILKNSSVVQDRVGGAGSSSE